MPETINAEVAGGTGKWRSKDVPHKAGTAPTPKISACRVRDIRAQAGVSRNTAMVLSSCATAAALSFRSAIHRGISSGFDSSATISSRDPP